MATLSIKELTSCIMSFMILAGGLDRSTTVLTANYNDFTDGSQVKSSHLYLYSAFNNTNCNKALHNIKIGKLCQ